MDVTHVFSSFQEERNIANHFCELIIIIHQCCYYYLFHIWGAKIITPSQKRYNSQNSVQSSLLNLYKNKHH